MGKASALTHFALEPGCDNNSFFDQAVADFEHGLDSICTNSVVMLNQDACINEPDTVTSSDFLGSYDEYHF